MSEKPVRLQLSRKRGFSLQALSLATNGLPAVNVARPGRHGNGFRVGILGIRTQAEAVSLFRGAHTPLPRWQANELRGNNLACWCGLDAPCHADALLDLANPTLDHAAKVGD
jgi:hypothetical protein